MDAVLLMEDLSDPINKFLPIDDVHVVEVEGRLFSCGPDMEVLRAQDVIPYKELYTINLRAKEIAASWYVSNGVDLTFWDHLGVSIGECLRYSLGIYVSRCLRHVMLLEKVADHPECGRVSIWGTVPAYLRSFIDGCPKPVTALNKKGGLHAPKQAIRRVLNHAFRLVVGISWDGKRQESVIHSCDERDGKACIYAPYDIATESFIKTIADRFPARVVTDQTESEPRENKLYVDYQDIFSDFQKRASSITGSPEYNKLCIGTGPWFRQVMDAWLQENLSDEAVNIISKSMRFARFLAEQEVDLLMMPMAWGGVQRAYIQVAKKMGIPSIVIQDGLLADDSMSAVPSVVADYAFVLGGSGHQWFARRGMCDDHVLSLGSLLWDAGGCRQIRRDEIDSLSSVLNVLYLAPRPAAHGAQFSYFETEEQIEGVCRVLSPYQNVMLKIRFHPRTKEWPGIAWRNKVQEQIRRISQNSIILDEREPLSLAVDEADLVISYCSTAAIQAARLGKPVITVEFSGREVDSADTTPVAFAANDLPSLIDKTVKNRSQVLASWRAISKKHVSENCNFPAVIAFINKAIASAREKARTNG